MDAGLGPYLTAMAAMTGLEVIKRSGAKRSVLVTSHDDQVELHHKLPALNAKLLPKWLVPSVGIWVRC